MKVTNVHWNFKHQFADDANALMHVIDHTLREVQTKREAKGEPLPSVLYIQLDNVSSNKNHWTIAYSCWLVATGVLDKVKLGFLLVGHTHENIRNTHEIMRTYTDTGRNTDETYRNQ